MRFFRRGAVLCGCVVMALGLVAGAPLQAAAPGDVLPFAATETVLPNGLKVIVVPTGFPNIVSVHVTVQTGSRNEVEPGKSGFAHFFEHLMFRGTPSTPPEQVPRDHDEGGRTRQREHGRRLHALLRHLRQGGPGDDHRPVRRHVPEPRVFGSRTSRPKRARFSASTTRTARTRSRSSSRCSANASTRRTPTSTRRWASSRTSRTCPDEYEYSKVFFERWYRPENTTLIVARRRDA